jgi:undecaprenyl-diphosphatase
MQRLPPCAPIGLDASLSAMDAAAVAGTVGAHALAWYLGLLGLLLACEYAGGSAAARWRPAGDVAPGLGRRDAAALPGLATALAFAAAAAFGVIAYVSRDHAWAQTDHALLEAIRANVPAAVVKQFKWITWFGDARTLTLLCVGAAAALLARGDKALACGLVAAVSANGLLNGAMKRLFDRSCPPHAMDALLGHGACFPSGHTSGAVVAYGMFAYVLTRLLHRRWHLPVLMPTTALVFTVGCSRIFVQAHFPSDVLAGFASGLAWLALGVALTESWLRRWPPGLWHADRARQTAPAA